MPQKSLSEDELKDLYKAIANAHALHLAKHDIPLPKLEVSGSFTKNAIVLAVLFKYQGQPVSKEELTGIIKNWYPATNDVQQARHLGRQKGWHIISGTRGDRGERGPNVITLAQGQYILVSLESPYPGYRTRRSPLTADFAELKAAYDFRCATCGSQEGEPNLLNPSRTTQLQAGHMDPRIDMIPGNTIPQCQECNQAYRDWFVFDERGRVRDINLDSPRWRRKYREIEDRPFSDDDLT